MYSYSYVCTADYELHSDAIIWYTFAIPPHDNIPTRDSQRTGQRLSKRNQAMCNVGNCRITHKTCVYMIVNDRFIAFFLSIMLCSQGQRCHKPIRNALKRSISRTKNTNTSCKPVTTGVLCNSSANHVLFEYNRSLF